MTEQTRTPRSGGRTTERQVGRGIRAHRMDPRGRDAARRFPTEGSAALRPKEQPKQPAAAGPRLKVAPPPPVTGPRVPFVALILVLVVGGVLGILVVNTKIAENAFRIERLKESGAALDLQQQELQREIAQAKAPGNLTAQARKLGMVGGGDPAYIRLQDGKVIGIPKPGAGAPSVTSDQTAGR
ncbi:hypothetical protein O7635_34980 [Asanoa sp. WMMD1127]|uniref:hypothetical protein n=1 Tax=Asanoa sp. WMMD1127 TaxID=3016107 RepID=UPI002416B6EC|nr:hypothetical protein [Asanoa sp. WMMD1127]MDG4827080.1 hypothetical protein [Asanoa sp. WMMD1127]